MEPARDTLIILGHGSSKHPGSSMSVRKHAELLAEQSHFAEVRAAFLKEEPFIEHCLEGLDAGRVLVVPDFLAEGYFTRQVIPRLLKAADNDESIICCPPAGTHPMVSELIEEAAEEVLGAWSMGETSLFVIGHGSGKNACSKQTLLHHLEQIRARSNWAQVQDLWLEEPPRVGEWSSLAENRQVVVVPYLLNDGQHGAWDIPRDLGLENTGCVHGVTHELGGYHVRITQALGTSDRFSEVIHAIATIWSGT